MNLDSNSQMQAREFFEAHYQHLRTHGPMRWMVRMFGEVIAGRCPRLIDLTTGAGKTELVTVWLLALAWYGRSGAASQPVPRRLVWIVNRRVLVQQVFAIAEELLVKLTKDESLELKNVRDGLRALSGNTEVVFDVVQLRGQIVANRDWAIRPTIPQLIIGTVDQIGSRLLFQGYGLGKWGRPQQAGLLGVDSWLAVDESHLVPAFVLTLRQLHPRCGASTDGISTPLRQLFERLPFWLTELSATPSLPQPSSDEPFQLTAEEKEDATITDRVLAAKTRRVEVEWLPNGDKPKDILTKALADAASKIASGNGLVRVAIFVRNVKDANAVEKQLKKAGIAQDHICKITGRLRGYERDRITQNNVFRRFLPQRAGDAANTLEGTVFLIGTAAAEVGLDADAEVILCDFAPLPTLLQRLGRLDRRGEKSRKVHEGGEPPTMKIFAFPHAKSKKEARVAAVAKALSDDTYQCSAQLMTGSHWVPAAEGKRGPDTKQPAEMENTVSNSSETQTEEASDTKKAKTDNEELVEIATWKILNVQTDDCCAQPATWLSQHDARVAAGPVAVPPLTNATLDHWCATTENPSRYLAPHPFLYGLLPETEGTPLVGIAFRLEIEALREAPTDKDEDDPEEPAVSTEVIEIFKKLPPQRAELHQVPISSVREWLASPAGTEHPLLYRERDHWRVKQAGETGSAVIDSLTPDTTILLPASAAIKTSYKKLLEDCEDSDTALCDVFDGVSKDARYRREVKEKQGGRMQLRSREDGAYLWDERKEREAQRVSQIALNVEPGDEDNWRRCLRKELRISGGAYVFRYFKPRREHGGLQYLDDCEGKSGHISRAQTDASRLAAALVPGDEFLKSLLCAAALNHDEGKRHKKWQRAFGREEGQSELAKLRPDLERNAPLHGFRHEWESLRRLDKANEPPPQVIAPENHTLWRDLLLHLVAVHHGHLRPSLEDHGLNPDFAESLQNPLRLGATERFARLQRQIGPWRLAYLEALLKTADALASQEEEHDED